MIYDFHEESSFRNWEIVDDGVMGGLSAGNLGIQRDGKNTKNMGQLTKYMKY